MKNLLKISAIILLSINCAALNAQVTVSQSSLTGITWTKLFDIFTSTMILTNDSICDSMESNLYGKKSFTFPYYLSDEIPTSFDSSKVGNVSSGKYIVEYNTKAGMMFVYSILELTVMMPKIVGNLSKNIL